MEHSIRDTIRRHRFALELAIGKLESESEAVVRLLKGMARELQEIDAREQRHDEGLKEARDKEPATSSQLDQLERLGMKVKEGLSEQEASALIGLARGKSKGDREDTAAADKAEE